MILIKKLDGRLVCVQNNGDIIATKGYTMKNDNKINVHL